MRSEAIRGQRGGGQTGDARSPMVRVGQCRRRRRAPATTARAGRHREQHELHKLHDKRFAQRAYLPIGFANIMCDMPPSHAIDCAVIYPAAGDARYTIRSATSSGLPTRLIGSIVAS